MEEAAPQPNISKGALWTGLWPRDPRLRALMPFVK